MLRFKVVGLGYSLQLTQRRQTATESSATFKLDFTVSYAGHAFQTCPLITSNKCVLVLAK